MRSAAIAYAAVAWGKRRNVNGTDDITSSIVSETTRGFTGEEQLSVAGLVHLNGRVYDPLLARMTSADPTVTDPMNPQGWNRYSYVGNDPLAFTDPNGYSWLSSFFHSVANALSSIPILRSIVQIGVTILVGMIPGVGAVVAAAAGAAIVNGLSGGNLGSILRSAAIAGVTAFAFDAVGDITGHTPSFGTSAHAANIAGHAAVGCGSAVASGGDCGSGALSGAVGSAFSPLTRELFPNARTDLGQRIGGTIVQATAGGLASVAGGGKFANGAVTGAFGYLFNDLAADAKGKLQYTPSQIGSEIDVYQEFAANPEHTYPLVAPLAAFGGAVALGVGVDAVVTSSPIVGRAAANLAEQLTMEEAMAGGGKAIMTGFSDPRYAAAGWQKYQVVNKLYDGTNAVVHYMKNSITGAMEQFKFK